MHSHKFIERPSILPEPISPESDVRYWNVPNLLCAFRLIGAVILIAVAWLASPIWFVGLYLVFAASDLIDGAIARWLDQESELGAGLDSIADIALSLSLLTGMLFLCGPALINELPWIALAIASYSMTSFESMRRFGKLPSFHTRTAKLGHFMVAVGGISLILGWSAWPLRIAALTVTLSNIEGWLITRRLTQWQSDVPSIWQLKKVNEPHE